MKRCILIDGSGYLFRAYHAMPPLTRSDGVPINAALGFAQMLLGTADRHQSDIWAVVFDAGRLNFRNEIYPEYKANRPPAPEDLIPQFPMVRDISNAMSIPTVEMVGYEADDIIATYVQQAVKEGYEVEILSSDKDLMQLVTEQVSLFDPLKQRRFTSKEVEEKFGVPPTQLQDVLALAGDSVDNIPGVPGIGIKTAALLIREYGTLAVLLENTQQIKQPKRRQALEDFAEQAQLSKRLVALDEKVPVPIPVNDLKRVPIDPDRMGSLLRTMEFKSLLRRMEHRWGTEGEAVDTKNEARVDPPRIVDDFSALPDGLLELEFGLLAIDFAKHPEHGCYLGFSYGKHDVVLRLKDFSVDSDPADVSLFNVGEAGGFSWPHLCQRIPAIKGKLGVRKIVFDAKLWVKRFFDASDERESAFIDLKSLDSLLRGSRALQRIDQLAEYYPDLPNLVKLDDKKVVANLNQDDFAHEIARRCRSLLMIYEGVDNKLWEKRLNTLYHHIERPLVPVVAAMERRGIRVDVGALEALRDEFAQQLHDLSEQVFQMIGERFNLASHKQLAEALTSRLKIKLSHRTRKGSISTDAEALEQLAEEGYGVADVILNWRQLYKLKTTYCDALLPYLSQTDRLRTDYTLQGAQTGRLSSNRPNLQNIPVRTEEGRKIRQVFIASEGYRLFSLDYNQIELRLLAEIADLDIMRAAFTDQRDIHAMTAEEVFGKTTNDAEAVMQRRRAKAINFGIIYGISTFGLARQIGVPREQAKTFIAHYHEKFPGIQKFMETTIATCNDHGYAETMFGRRVYLPDIKNAQQFKRKHAERQAINAPIQGSAADIMKRSMIKVAKMLTAHRYDVHMLLQVHDESVIEVKDTEQSEVVEAIKDQMEKAASPLRSLSIPLRVDVGFGSNWDTAH